VELELKESGRNGHEPPPAPLDVDERMLSPTEPRPQRHPQRGDNIERLRAEIDGYHRQLRGLNAMDTSEVLQTLSAISARISELRVQLNRRPERQATAIRLKELDPLHEEIDRQFKFHSRLLSVREMEAKTMGGFV
jgi:hypothetical protein